MERGQRDLGSAGEPQFVIGKLVGLFLVARELALVEEGLLARDRRNRDRGEARFGDLLQRPAHQLGLEQGQPALEAIGPRSRHLDDPAQIAPVVLLDQRDMVERLEIEFRHRALGADDDIAVLVGPDRRALPRDAGQLEHHGLERRFLVGQRRFQLARPRARRLGLGAQRRALLGRGALEARADRIALGPKRLDLALGGAHFGVERQQRIEVEIDPFGGNRLADRVAVRPDEIHAQHGTGNCDKAGARGKLAPSPRLPPKRRPCPPA